MDSMWFASLSPLFCFFQADEKKDDPKNDATESRKAMDMRSQIMYFSLPSS
jgi:hypothetical protein